LRNVRERRPVLRESLIPYNQSPKVLKPRQQSLDLPPPSVATQGTTVLRSVRPRLPVWRDQLHASPGQFCIQAVRLVGVVADETLGSGRTNRAASVARTSVTSCGVALST